MRLTAALATQAEAVEIEVRAQAESVHSGSSRSGSRRCRRGSADAR